MFNLVEVDSGWGLRYDITWVSISGSNSLPRHWWWCLLPGPVCYHNQLRIRILPRWSSGPFIIWTAQWSWGKHYWHSNFDPLFNVVVFESSGVCRNWWDPFFRRHFWLLWIKPSSISLFQMVFTSLASSFCDSQTLYWEYILFAAFFFTLLHSLIPTVVHLFITTSSFSSRYQAIPEKTVLDCWTLLLHSSGDILSDRNQIFDHCF